MSCIIEKPAVVVRGEDRELSLDAINSSNEKPFDLTGVTEIVACFTNELGTVLTKKMTDALNPIVMVEPKLGSYKIPLITTETDTLAEVIKETLRVEFTLPSGKKRVAIYNNALTVISRGCLV